MPFWWPSTQFLQIIVIHSAVHSLSTLSFCLGLAGFTYLFFCLLFLILTETKNEAGNWVICILQCVIVTGSSKAFHLLCFLFTSHPYSFSLYTKAPTLNCLLCVIKPRSLKKCYFFLFIFNLHKWPYINSILFLNLPIADGNFLYNVSSNLFFLCAFEPLYRVLIVHIWLSYLIHNILAPISVLVLSKQYYSPSPLGVYVLAKILTYSLSTKSGFHMLLNAFVLHKWMKISMETKQFVFLHFFFCNISPPESEIGPHTSWKHLYSAHRLGKPPSVVQCCKTIDVISGLMHANRRFRKEVSSGSSEEGPTRVWWGR